MEEVLSIQELRKKYAEVMDNEAVTRIANWEERNTDMPCDEQAYRKKALENSDTLHTTIAQIEKEIARGGKY